MSGPAAVIGRQIKTSGAEIVGVVSCLPSREILNSEFLSQFGEAAVNDVVKMIGVERRYWVDEKTTTLDLCAAAGKKLLSELNWEPETIDAILFVSQTPDFRLPASACCLQSELRLSKATVAFDVNLGCSGYPYALWLGMMMVQTGAARRVLLAVGDTISKIVDPSDRSTALLFGDAGTMTAIQKSDDGSAFFVLGTDGGGASHLNVPSGAFRTGMGEADSRLRDKNPSCLFMDGGEIFNFTLKSVPKLVDETLQLAESSIDDHGYFLFHQANMFMVKHLVKKSKIPQEKAPININKFGNTSCASIPLLMTSELVDVLKAEKVKIGMFGFGVGYSWAGASIDVGPLKCIRTISI